MMAAFNAGSPAAIFELYNDFLVFGLPMLPRFTQDHEIQQKILLTAYIQLLIIDGNEWTYTNAKVCYAVNLFNLCRQWRLTSSSMGPGWFIDSVRTVPQELPAAQLADICVSLLETSDWKEMRLGLRSAYLDFLKGAFTDLSTRMGFSENYTLLAYLLAFSKKNSEKISG